MGIAGGTCNQMSDTQRCHLTLHTYIVYNSTVEFKASKDECVSEIDLQGRAVGVQGQRKVHD